MGGEVLVRLGPYKGSENEDVEPSADLCGGVWQDDRTRLGTWRVKRPPCHCGARWRRMPCRRALRAAWVMARAALGWRAYDPLVAPPRKTGAGCASVAAFTVAWLAGTQGRRWGAASRGAVPPSARGTACGKETATYLPECGVRVVPAPQV